MLNFFLCVYWALVYLFGRNTLPIFSGLFLFLIWVIVLLKVLSTNPLSGMEFGIFSHISCITFFYNPQPSIYFIDFQGKRKWWREEGKGRERGRSMWERETSIHCLLNMLWPGVKPHSLERERERNTDVIHCLRNGRWIGVKLTTFWCTEQWFNQGAT